MALQCGRDAGGERGAVWAFLGDAVTRVLADTIYTTVHDNGDGTYRARCDAGWHVAYPGDCINFGNGATLSIDGPAEIGGGSVKLCLLAVVLCVGGLAISNWVNLAKVFGS